MQYIVMDLEWNSAYSHKKKGFINEIIEIGAVRLNDALEFVDSFSMLIKPKISKRLQGRVKELTHLSNEDVQEGVTYSKAIEAFSNWLQEEENIFLTWGDGDIRTMLQNHLFFLNEETIPFIDNYVDIQKYCQTILKMSLAQQVGLSDAAVKMGLDAEKYAHHRALGDSFLTVDCFKKLYDTKKFISFIQRCDADFYGKLNFKPYFLRNMQDEKIPKEIFNCVCDQCGGTLKKEKNWRFQNHAFYATFFCKKCKRHIRFSVRCKQLYDHVDIRKTSKEIVPKPPTPETKEKATAQDIQPA